MQKKFLALLLRGSSMGSKFLLVIGLSKELTTSEYGVFSLTITTLTFLIFFIGFDFYNFSHREIIENEDKKVQFLVSQFWFHLFCYFIYIPIIYFIFSNDIIPLKYIFPFYTLLVLEHIGQELFRFFNLFNKPNHANFTLLIRTAVWIGVMIIVEHLIFNREITIMNLLYYWIGGSLLAIIYSLTYVARRFFLKFKDIKFFSINHKWIKSGIKVSMPFFFGTIAYKIIEYSDRYMIDWFLDKEQVGIYSFYANFANIVNITVNTITITLIVPNLLRAVSSNEVKRIKIKIHQFSKELYLTTTLVSVCIIILIFPTLSWLDKPEFSNELSTYFIILLANIIFNLSLLYHFLLYAYKKDREIFKPTVYASITNIVLNIVLIPRFGIISAAISTLVSAILIFILKSVYWRRVKMLLN
jgi:O-antigen/teichoic acid export membrane protein